MNKSDSERIATILRQLGCQPTGQDIQANILIVVACSVRQSALDRIYGKINQWEQLKKQNLEKLILTGCVLDLDKQKLGQHFDLILPIDEITYLPKFLGYQQCLTAADYLQLLPLYESRIQAFVPIMTGCNNFCSYCVVPYVRGRERSRPVKDILAEVKELIGRGYKEIILLGQNVNSYQDGAVKFPELLKLVHNIPGKFWLRFITSHPKDMSDKLIKAMAKLEKVCEYIHLPIQAGDNQILKKMNRGYTCRHYLGLIKKIRRQIPSAAISTDVIVGFPGETDKQFQQTVKVFKQVKFAMAYIAQYSPRSQTAAAQLADDVPKAIKKQRVEILTDILTQTALEYNQQLVSQTVEVLVLAANRGRTRTFKNVRLVGADNLVGEFVKVKIISATSWGLKGVINNE